MVFKFHQYRFDNFNKYYEVIREAMKQLGHSEVVEESPADIHFYNHIVNDSQSDNMIIVKPTAPTSKHFALDKLGYANTSEMAYEDPYVYEYMYSHANPKNNMDWNIITDLINNKSNKWDDSILLKWKKGKKVEKDHTLVIGQMPKDETVEGFGLGGHIKKLDLIVEKLAKETNYPIVAKMHPRLQKRDRLIEKWKSWGVDVREGFESIHDILPRTRVAIIDNSTAGIECLMHEVPIISYGWPEYHWVTKKLQTLPQLKTLIEDPTKWHKRREAKQFIYWYINDYLCYDVESTKKRLDGIINS